MRIGGRPTLISGRQWTSEKRQWELESRRSAKASGRSVERAADGLRRSANGLCRAADGFGELPTSSAGHPEPARHPPTRQLIRHVLDAEAAVPSRPDEWDLSPLQEDGSPRDSRLSAHISVLSECLRTVSPCIAERSLCRIRYLRPWPAPALSHKRSGRRGRGGRLRDNSPRVDVTRGRAYHQLKRRNDELIDMLP